METNTKEHVEAQAARDLTLKSFVLVTIARFILAQATIPPGPQGYAQCDRACGAVQDLANHLKQHLGLDWKATSDIAAGAEWEAIRKILDI